MRLILTEKPSQGRIYADALGVAVKRDGYLEGDDCIITWCIGHLVELANADVYDEKYKKWRVEDLPIIPDNWKYAVTADKNKQFDIIRKLMHDPRMTEIINACDCGREGELIFRLVYEKAACKLPIKRLWISSMEESAIIDGFANLKDGAEFDSLYHSALCRSQADWLIGINATRLFTKLYNKMLNVGRVQTPTLAMIFERAAAINNFEKEKYFNVCMNDFAVSERINSEEEAEKIKAACDGQKAVVTSVKRETKTVNPPKLYDLTTLQREANRIYGFTAQQTLDYAQSLYESRLITYPRTDSRYITEDMSESTSNVIDVIIQVIPQFSGLSYDVNVQRVIKNSAVSDHFALLTTAEVAKADISALPDGERKILLLIAGRLLSATAEKHEYEAVTATIECCGSSFTAKGKSIINDAESLCGGFKAIERLYRGKDGEESGENETPLNLNEGEEITAVCAVSEHFTQPPKQFTEDTLLSSMQRAAADEITENAERHGRESSKS